MKKQLTYEEALSRLQNLCSTREKCSYDVFKKLYEYGIITSDAEKILKKLQQDDFVNDERFAFSYARSQHKFAKWGKKKIAQHLSAKRIPTAIIENALSEIDDQKYSETIESELRKKLKTTKAKNKQELTAKLLRFALSRGYDYEISCNHIKSLLAGFNTNDA